MSIRLVQDFIAQGKGLIGTDHQCGRVAFTDVKSFCLRQNQRDIFWRCAAIIEGASTARSSMSAD